MTTPWHKIRDKVAASAALEGLLLFDSGVQALADAQARDTSTNEHNTANPPTQQALRLHDSLLSFDTDDLSFGEDEERILEEGLSGDLELGLEALDKEIAGLEEFGDIEDLERDLKDFEKELEDFERAILADIDIDIPGSSIGAMLRPDDGPSGASNQATSSVALPGWDEFDDMMEDDLNTLDADTDIMMGMLIMGMAEELAGMSGPYNRHSFKDRPSASMQRQGRRLRKTNE